MTLGETLLMAIVVLLLRACGMLWWYGVRLLQERVKMQRRLGRMWLTIHQPTDSLTQEERQAQI